MPVDLSTVRIPRFPYPDELAAIVTGRASDHHGWPPPGMARLAPFGSISYALTGVASEPGWWWSTAEEINPAITGVENVLAAARWTGMEVSATIRAAVEVLGWVPLVFEQGEAMDWIKIGIHAQLGSNEQMIHTFSLTPNGSGTPSPLPSDEAGTVAVAAAVAAAWATAMDEHPPVPSGASTSMNGQIGTHVTYDAVTAAVLRQTVPSPKDPQRGDPNLVQTLVPTQRANFLTLVRGLAGGAAMPYEVACAITLLTRQAGSRNRGRVYLGGLMTSIVAGSEGKFITGSALALGWGVGHFCELIRTTTPWQVSIASRRGLVDHEVTRTAVGLVPDSQRRRRGGQTENRVTVWDAP